MQALRLIRLALPTPGGMLSMAAQQAPWRQPNTSVPQLISLRDFGRIQCASSGSRDGALQKIASCSSGSLPRSVAASSAVLQRQIHKQTSAPAAAQQDADAHDRMYMSKALAEARKAAAAGEVPVGAVLVLRGDVITCAHNSTASSGDPTAHAEISCIQQAAKALGSWRLRDATLYCTLEPCAMCAGAMLQSRVGTLVYGARNALSGADGSWVDLLSSPAQQPGLQPVRRPHSFHPDIQVRRGVLGEECSELLREFFRWRRTQPGYCDSDLRVQDSEDAAMSSCSPAVA